MVPVGRNSDIPRHVTHAHRGHRPQPVKRQYIIALGSHFNMVDDHNCFRLPLYQMRIVGAIDVTQPTLGTITFLLRNRPESNSA